MSQSMVLMYSMSDFAKVTTMRKHGSLPSTTQTQSGESSRPKYTEAPSLFSEHDHFILACAGPSLLECDLQNEHDIPIILISTAIQNRAAIPNARVWMFLDYPRGNKFYGDENEINELISSDVFMKITSPHTYFRMQRNGYEMQNTFAPPNPHKPLWMGRSTLLWMVGLLMRAKAKKVFIAGLDGGSEYAWNRKYSEERKGEIQRSLNNLSHGRLGVLIDMAPDIEFVRLPCFSDLRDWIPKKARVRGRTRVMKF